MVEACEVELDDVLAGVDPAGLAGAACGGRTVGPWSELAARRATCAGCPLLAVCVVAGVRKPTLPGLRGGLTRSERVEVRSLAVSGTVFEPEQASEPRVLRSLFERGRLGEAVRCVLEREAAERRWQASQRRRRRRPVEA